MKRWRLEGFTWLAKQLKKKNPKVGVLLYGGPEEMRAYALNLQLHFLATRFAGMRRMRGLGGSWILDRTWYEDAEIFARGLHAFLVELQKTCRAIGEHIARTYFYYAVVE